MKTRILQKFKIFLLIALPVTSIFAGNMGSSPYTPPNRAYGAIDWFVNRTKIGAPTGEESVVVTNIFRGQFGYAYARRDAIYLFGRGSWGGGGGYRIVNNTNMNLSSIPWYLEARGGYQFGFGRDKALGFTPYTGYFLMGQKTKIKNPAIPGDWETAQQQSLLAGGLVDYIINPEFRVGVLVEALINLSGNTKSGGDIIISEKVNINNGVNWLGELPITWMVKPNLDLTLVPSYVWVKSNLTNGAFAVEHNHGIRLEVGFRF